MTKKMTFDEHVAAHKAEFGTEPYITCPGSYWLNDVVFNCLKRRWHTGPHETTLKNGQVERWTQPEDKRMVTGATFAPEWADAHHEAHIEEDRSN